ncbi:precorrin-2 dehydrogenase/sirohydrochlorin ferrochelatase family protein [Anaeromicropila herbilytica]|uniref:precorrin-2 dehydrogenase n=1 Tax=Anaeromicropila herbilytica TaxID=2785025 RepID=A0A7R7ENQ9_9FIRM|nr:bifunctional precorrin-2 dehydrogenase/sirohydrochlorin ferrochelatase [Anaeromicropila herbilytica]BCN32173.1 hypothetical protein bsdtb5_34680 [Anaeromicropila herbilytica]
MAYFPMFIDVKGTAVAIIGAGDVALRKVKVMLEYEAKITVIAIDVSDEIWKLEKEKKIIVRQKAYDEEDIKDAALVIAATNDTTLNKRISAYCKEHRIPVNVVDVQEECSFIFPAYVKQGPITVGVTSSGASPVISQKIKKMVMNTLPDYYGELADSLGKVREEVQKKIDTEKERKQVFKKLIAIGEERKGRISYDDLEEVLKKK